MLVMTGCGSKDPPQQKTSEPAKTTEAPTPTTKPVDDYAGHMQAGDAFEQKKKWSEAYAEFELALTAKPKDAKALGEVGFTAYHAGKLARAREASEAAVEAAGKATALRGAALYNLGLAVERTLPNAAASLYSASNAVRKNVAVRARLARLASLEPVHVRETTPEGDALLAKVHVDPIQLKTPRHPATPLDRGLFDALAAANVDYEGAAGKAVALVENLSCTEDTAPKPATYLCTNPAVANNTAKLLFDNFVARKIAAKQEGTKRTVSVASVRCATYDVELSDGQLPADSCDVTK